MWQPTPVFLPGEFAWTEEPGRLQSLGSQRVGHDWATKHSPEHKKSRREGICIYMWLIHLTVLQKLAQCCEVTIPQLKKMELILTVACCSCSYLFFSFFLFFYFFLILKSLILTCVPFHGQITMIFFLPKRSFFPPFKAALLEYNLLNTQLPHLRHTIQCFF